jgi:hypothetical protein
MLLCCDMRVEFAPGPSQMLIIQRLEVFNHLMQERKLTSWHLENVDTYSTGPGAWGL